MDWNFYNIFVYVICIIFYTFIIFIILNVINSIYSIFLNMFHVKIIIFFLENNMRQKYLLQTN